MNTPIAEQIQSPDLASSSPTPTRPLLRTPWRFTIREIMLLTAAVAGFLAWANLFYQRSKSYERTAVPDHLGNFDHVQTICRSLGHQIASYSGGGGGSSGPHGTTRTYDCEVDLPLNLHGEFMEAYREHILEVLFKHADTVSGGSTTRGSQGLRAFNLEYDNGKTHGTVAVRSMANDNGLTMLVLVHEHQLQP
jgi:hypothetical protein